MSAETEARERFFAAINHVFRAGRIVQHLSFAQRARALAWAGIEDPEPA